MSKQIVMSACSSQKQYQPISVDLINKQPIRLNMTFPVAAAITRQPMIPIFCFKRFTVCKSSNNRFDFIKVISSLLRKLQVFPELI